MRDYYLQIVMDHKATVIAILTAWGSTILALLDMIPDSSIAKLASIASIFACVCLGIYHKHNAAKAYAERVRQEIENEMLMLDLKRKHREEAKQRRKEDQED